MQGQKSYAHNDKGICVCVYIGGNIHANSGHVRCHVTIACHSTSVMTLTANEFLYNSAGTKIFATKKHGLSKNRVRRAIDHSAHP